MSANRVFFPLHTELHMRNCTASRHSRYGSFISHTREVGTNLEARHLRCRGDVRTIRPWSFRVKIGKAQCEQMFSALPLRADIAQCSRHVRFVPIEDSCTAAIRALALPTGLAE